MNTTHKKINWFKSIIAGIVGTILFDLVGLIMTGTWWDIPGVLSKEIGVPFPVALLMHYGNGVALAVIYAALHPSLVGPGWFKALAFTTLETVMLVWFLLFPLLGLGIGGFEGGLIYPFLSMLRHWVFAIPLAYSCRAELETDSDPVGAPA